MYFVSLFGWCSKKKWVLILVNVFLPVNNLKNFDPKYLSQSVTLSSI
jgi:hypothetical protein